MRPPSTILLSLLLCGVVCAQDIPAHGSAAQPDNTPRLEPVARPDSTPRVEPVARPDSTPRVEAVAQPDAAGRLRPAVVVQHDGASSAPIVTGFAIRGNAVTKPEIILRELTLDVGDTVTQDAIEYCQARIYSLGLFNNVRIYAPPMDSTVLLIDVEERWYYYPVPMLGIVDRDVNHWYYGLGAVHQNVSGRNEKLFGAVVFGYSPWASLSYANPWVFGEQQLFIDTQFGWSRTPNKSYVARGAGGNFEESRYTLAQSLGKRFDPYRSAWIQAAFTYVGVNDWKPGRTASPGGIDRTISLAAGFQHDTRNLREYPTQGIFGSVTLAKKGLGFGGVDLVRATADLRGYRDFSGGMSLGARVLTSVAEGPAIPYYERMFFGYGERIRGHFSQAWEGDNIAGVWTELRIPIVSSFLFRMPELPIPGFSTLRFGVYAALFADAGVTWNRHQRVPLSDIPSGYGAGLHLLLPYGFVARIDRAWNERAAGEWVFDLGASF